MISITVTGTQSVVRTLRRTRAGLLRQVEQQVDRIVRPATLKLVLPKRTGRLRRTLKVRKRRGRNTVDWTIVVGGRKAVYAPYVRVRGQSGRARYAFARLVRQRVERGVSGIRPRVYR